MAIVSECPEATVLERLLLGRIGGTEAERLEEHLAGCSHCAEALHSLRGEDNLVRAMRVSRQPDATALHEMLAIIPLLKRLRPSGSQGAKDTGETPVPRKTDLSPTGELTVSLPPDVGESVTLPPGEGTGMPPVPRGPDFLAAAQSADEMGRLGPYRVLRELGSGGMGMVFLADDPRLKRHIALKVIRPELVARTDIRERLVREAQAIAALEHENIVAVFEVNEDRGVPYLAMPLLRGQSLEERLEKAGGPLPLDETLRIGRQIAEGLAAAHDRSLIHRDIKPGNVFLAEVGPASRAVPTVKVLDFGLARALGGEEGDAAGTHVKAVTGTPAFMAPEQAQGLPLDARCDLFSLGCVLYRMATGKPPFVGNSVISTLVKVSTEPVTPPRAVNPKISRPLEKLILKLLEKKPADRPPSAHAVVAALRNLERKPRALVPWLVALGPGLIAAGLLVAWWLNSGPRPTEPEPPGEVTFEVEEPDLHLLTIQRGDDAEQPLDLEDGRTRTLSAGDYAVRRDAGGPPAPRDDRRLLPDHFLVKPGEAQTVALRLVGEVRQSQGYSHGILSVALSPRQGSLLSLAASRDTSVGVWDAATGKPADFLEGHASPVLCVAFSPDGRLAASGSGGKDPSRTRKADLSIRIWDLQTKRQVGPSLEHGSWVQALAFSPDGKKLLSGGDEGSVFVWDVQTRQRLHTLAGHGRLGVNSVAFSPDGHKALSGGADKRIVLWDADTGRLLRPLEGHTGEVNAIAFAPDGNRATSASNDGTIRVWDLATGKSREILGHKGEVCCVAWSPDGRRLLSGGRDRTLRLWDAVTGKELYRFQGHRETVHGVAFAADGRRALSGSADRTVRLWTLPQ